MWSDEHIGRFHRNIEDRGWFPATVVEFIFTHQDDATLFILR